MSESPSPSPLSSSAVTVRDYRQEDTEVVYSMWRCGFYEMREDGFERLSQSRIVHICLGASSALILHYCLSLPLSFSIGFTFSLIVTDILGFHSLYRELLRRLHGFIFWHVTGLVGRTDMKTADALQAHWMKQNYSHFWVAEVDGSIVGCIGCRLQHALIHPSRSESNEASRTREASVWRLTVHPEYRKLGVGRILMSVAERWAAAQGATAMSLVTANKASAVFYRRLGYLIETKERCEHFTYLEGTWKPKWIMDPIVRSRTHPESGTLFVKPL
jgi:ribosomal protein S18 acetylase RimI-like enzyme